MFIPRFCRRKWLGYEDCKIVCLVVSIGPLPAGNNKVNNAYEAGSFEAKTRLRYHSFLAGLQAQGDKRKADQPLGAMVVGLASTTWLESFKSIAANKALQ